MIVYYLSNLVLTFLSGAVQSSPELSDKLGFDLSKIVENDAIIKSVIGYVIVFLALFILYVFISNLSKVLHFNLKKKLLSLGKEVKDKKDLEVTGEVNAAIATALHLYFEEVHDFENTVLTIDKVRRVYQPWSSKIYNFTKEPGKVDFT